MVYIYRNASKCYVAEFTRSVEPLKCISIYSYLLSIGKTIKWIKTNSSAQPVQHEKSLCRTKMHVIKRGLERKNHAVKKLQQIRNEKHAMCEWDH